MSLFSLSGILAEYACINARICNVVVARIENIWWVDDDDDDDDDNDGDDAKMNF